MNRNFYLPLIVMGAFMFLGVIFYLSRINHKVISGPVVPRQNSAGSTPSQIPLDVSDNKSNVPAKPNAQIQPGAITVVSPAGTLKPYRIPSPFASVKIDGKTLAMTPNAIGSYPRFTVPENAVIPIHLIITPKFPAEIQVLDGGSLDNHTTIQDVHADQDGNIDFHFQVKTAPGSYRVAVYHDGDRQIMDFWVGPDLPQRVSGPPK